MQIIAFKAMTIILVIVMATFVAYGVLCVRENRRRDKLGDIAMEDHAFQDQTDKVSIFCPRLIYQLKIYVAFRTTSLSGISCK